MSSNPILEALSRVKQDAESLGYTASELAELQNKLAEFQDKPVSRDMLEHASKLYKTIIKLHKNMSLLIHSLNEATKLLDKELGGVLLKSYPSIKKLANEKGDKLRQAILDKSFEEKIKTLIETVNILQKYINDTVDSLLVDYRQPVKASKLMYSLLILLHHLSPITYNFIMKDAEYNFNILKASLQLHTLHHLSSLL